MLNEWSYYILTPGGQSYQIENGIVVAIGNYKPLEHTPIGWQDISLIWERSSTKYGLTRSFTLPLGFVIEGQTILTYLRWTGNFERQLSLLINRRTLYLDTNQYYYWYKFFYKGDIDLSTYKYDDDNSRADVQIMEGGISKQLNANQDTIFEVPIDPNFLWVKMDGIIIDSIRNFKNPAQTVTSIPSPSFPIPIVNLPGENDGIGIVGQSQNENDGTTGILLWADPIPAHVSGIIRFTVNDAVQTLNVELNKLAAGSFTPTLIRFQSYSPNTTDIFEFVLDDDITLAAGEQLLIGISALAPSIGALPLRSFTFIETTITATLQSRGATSYIKVKQPLELGRMLTQNITGNADDFKSDKIASQNNIVVTSGDAIRGIDGAVIKCSYNQYFNSYNVVMNLGTGVEEEKLVVEEKLHFFKTDNPISLGQVKQYKDGSATDYLANTLLIGYPDVNMDDVNGKYAFNTSVLWSCKAISRIKKELTIKSDFKADPYEIDLIRIKYLGQTTTDSEKDNDVYFLVIDLEHPEIIADGRTVYPLLRNPADIITGIPHGETAFNLSITPRRLINIHSNWIAGVFAEFQGEVLHFETTQRNRSLVVNGLDEDADIQISSLGSPLFKPVNFDFQSPFLPTGDLSMNNIDVYSENAQWIHTGDGDPNDTSSPRTGTKAVKVTAIIGPQVKFIGPQPIPFSALNSVSFYMKLTSVLPPLTILKVSFYKGTQVGRSGNVAYNRASLIYQSLIINFAGLTVINSAIEEFDTIVISIAGLVSVTLFLDDITLSINPQIDLPSVMDANPNRCFSFIHPNGKTLKGHTIKVGAAPNTEQEQGFLLLATGDTNLEDLVI